MAHYPREAELIELAVRAGRMTADRSSPRQWVEWAAEKGIVIPPHLLKLTQPPHDIESEKPYEPIAVTRPTTDVEALTGPEQEAVVEPTPPLPAQTGQPAAPVGRRDLQIQAILAAIKVKGYPPNSIPHGGKAVVEKCCLKNHPSLFTPEAFKKAWQEARNRGLLDVENADSYRSGKT